jgi:hypothetical protein
VILKLYRYRNPIQFTTNTERPNRADANKIQGCDFHPSWQQVSWLDTETGETGEQKLVQSAGDAERFYRQVPAPGLIVMEATGNCHLPTLMRPARVLLLVRAAGRAHQVSKRVIAGVADRRASRALHR